MRLFNQAETSWASVRADILGLEHEAFGRGAFEEDYLREEFGAPENVVVLLLKESEAVAGFSIAGPVSRYNPHSSPDAHLTAYIPDTVIEASSRGQGLVKILMSGLEQELRRQGYRFVERHAAVANGYSSAISRAYGSRIITRMGPVPSEWGQQMFYRIRL